MSDCSSVKELELICQNRWPQIICHCPDLDPIQRIRFCLHHAGLCTLPELKADPTLDLISKFTERVERMSTSSRDSDRLSSSISLFSEITSPETIRKCLTGPLLQFPMDVVFDEGGKPEITRSEVSIRAVQALEQELGRLGAHYTDAAEIVGVQDSAPNCTDLIASLRRLSSTIRSFQGEFASSLSSVLQSNAPLLQLQSSPVGEQLGSTAADLGQHLRTFRQLMESIRAVRDSLEQIRANPDTDAAGRYDSDSVTELQRQIRILQTASTLAQSGS